MSLCELGLKKKLKAMSEKENQSYFQHRNTYEMRNRWIMQQKIASSPLFPCELSRCLYIADSYVKKSVY